MSSHFSWLLLCITTMVLAGFITMEAVPAVAVSASVNIDVHTVIKEAILDNRKEVKRQMDVLRKEASQQVDALRKEIEQPLESLLEKLWDQKTEIARLNAAVEELASQCAAPGPTPAESDDVLDQVAKRVTGMLRPHQQQVARFGERVDYLEAELQKVHDGGRRGRGRERRLQISSGTDSVDTSVLDDAALWMQANYAKILFGPLADTNLYRSDVATVKTEGSVIIDNDLTVKGENWHLTTMLTAAENVTVGNVISLCQGKACVGYGLAGVGSAEGINTAGVTDVNVISLGGSAEYGVMVYRLWSSSHESQPMLRLVKTRDTIKNVYAPTLVQETPLGSGGGPVSELSAVALTDTTFLVLYRESGSMSSTRTQGAVRLCTVTAPTTNSPFTCTSPTRLSLYKGAYGFKKGTVVYLGSNGQRFGIFSEHTDVDSNGDWLGTATFTLGTTTSSGVQLGSPVVVTTRVSQHHAVVFNNYQHVLAAYRSQKSGDQGALSLLDVSGAIPTVSIMDQVFSQDQVQYVSATMMSTKVACVLFRTPTQSFAGSGFLVHLVQSDTQLTMFTSVPVAPGSSIDNSYAMRVARITDGQLVFVYRNGQGLPRVVDADVVGTTIVVGSPRRFMVLADTVAHTYGVATLNNGAFMVAYQDNEANKPNTAMVAIMETHGGALRTGVATSVARVGEEVQVALEGAVRVPPGMVTTASGAVISAMTPGARYYAKYDGGISPSSGDGVLLGRALRGSLLLLERDFAGGFDAESSGGGEGGGAFAGEIRTLAGATVPSGWLPCDGRAVSRIDFSALFAAINTIWGDGDGASTFNIPDMRGRTTIGAGLSTGGGDLSLEPAQVTQANASRHELGGYSGTESFGIQVSMIRNKFPNRRYCITSNSLVDNNWCRPTYEYHHSTWAQYTSGKFIPGQVTYTPGTTVNHKNNMMPHATVTYIIKT